MATEEDVAAAVDVEVGAITEISLEMEALIERRPHHHEEPRRRSSCCSIGASILKGSIHHFSARAGTICH